MGGRRWKEWLRPAASLRLTLPLLAAAMALVFLGTLDQVNLGIHQTQEKYFRSFWVGLPFPGTERALPILPGGYLIGTLLLLNLGAAFTSRFRLRWDKCGIWMLHGGLVLFLATEVVQAWFSVEGTMRLDEGDSQNYFESAREVELVVIEPAVSGTDRVHSVPEGMLREGKRVALPGLSLELDVREVFANSRILSLTDPDGRELAGTSDSGIGRQVGVTAIPPTRRNDERNLVSVVVEARHEGERLGTWLLSNGLSHPQTLRAGGGESLIAVRNKRHYRSHTLTLLRFRHERHPGTDTPKHFSSRLRLTAPERSEDRPVLISMNQPFRYRGDIVYQSGFDNGDRTSILRVVRNPGWPLPYVATAVAGLGLLYQFGIGLVRFLRRRRAEPVRRSSPSGPQSHGAGKLIVGRVLGLLGISALLFVTGWRAQTGTNDFDSALREFGAMPVQAHGRIQPMDALARNTLLHLQGRTRVVTEDGARQESAEWLLDVLFYPERADALDVFRIVSPEVLDWVTPGREAPAYLSFNQLAEQAGEFGRQAMLADQVPEEERSLFQKEILRLAYSIDLYQRLKASFSRGGPGAFATEAAKFDGLVEPGLAAARQRANGENYDEDAYRKMAAFSSRYMRMESEGLLRPFPVSNDRGDLEWKNAGGVLVARMTGAPLPEVFWHFSALEEPWRQRDLVAFREALGRVDAELREAAPEAVRRAGHEAFFIRTNLFNRTGLLYGAGLLCVLGSWIWWPARLRRVGVWILLGAFALHTIGLLLRIYLHGRPPVTNLYASAVFVGWGAVLLGLVWERFFRNGLAAAGAAMAGVVTLIIAHQLSLAGDTLESLRAVLDSNFWLATHVIVITVGYSAMFLAGGIAAFGLLWPGGGADSRFDRKRIATMVYGILCFATLFTFVGTVLGGIWADQSWGRFWGWDPKENGALLIVLWNAMILHGRLGGIIGARGLLVMAVFGNVVTAFAWFGVNLLGVGLHSYGFMEGGWFWLGLFIVVNLAVMAGGWLAGRRWVFPPH